MLTLTPIERDMHRLLRSLAKAGDPADPLSVCIGYKEFVQRVDPHGLDPYTSQGQMRGLYPKLGHISAYEHQHGRPLLSALVIRKATGRPGAGFADLASQLGFEAAEEPEFWEHQVEQSVRFWSADDPVMLLDSAMDQVLKELGSLKRAVRRLAARPAAKG
ncbi:hypothetical protein EDD90_1948 [Streptomyces sp. Ag109_O5-1]|uniref:hypothetical protein n=1 Tax=Streptomyces sp. Ag109_O5-1 TaxID=1938851 RepID=UPI000F4D8E84|nr:hypothetical protein [Streptomyces sp. Ag109_O5-1]RPE38998.1 hypothetical protein EDD90_1948 [Streptomyces sp. Ag109_O5-1]